MFNLIAAQCAKLLEKTCSEICLIKVFFKESSAEECSIPIHVPQYVIHVENLPWAYRIVGICVHKTYCKFGARINCNIRMSYSSQFSLISILLNINKASNHCDCWRTITNAYGQCIEADRGLLQGSRNLIMFFPRRMRLLFIGYCVWSFSHYPIADDHVVHYLAKTRGRFETLQQRCHKLAFFFGSNLAEKGVQNHKSSDVTEGLSATKSLKCLGSNEGVQH